MRMKAAWLAAAVAVAAFVAVGSAQTMKSAQAKEPAPKAMTWMGKISDSGCGANKHTMGPDADCVKMCVKGGGEYVFVGDKNKVYKIANQKFADLAVHAGHTVDLTGTLKDDTITVTKIVMPKT